MRDPGDQVAKDMGLDISITLSIDASTVKGISTGKGSGKGRHMETEGIVAVKKTGDDRNVADVLTKYLSSLRLRSLLADLPVTEVGRIHWSHSCRVNRDVHP